VRPSATTLLRRMNSTRNRSGTGIEQVDGEEDANPEAIAQLPQNPGAEPHRQGLIDRRRLHGAIGGRVPWGRPLPRGHPGLAVVTVAGELASAAPDRVAKGEGWRHQVEQDEAKEIAVAGQSTTASAPPITPPYQTSPEPEKMLPIRSCLTLW